MHSLLKKEVMKWILSMYLMIISRLNGYHQNKEQKLDIHLQVYNPLKIINITVIFTKTVFIKNMVYQAWSLGNNKGIGYPEELVIYY